MTEFPWKSILAVGDCNTLGIGNNLGNSYPERLGKRFGCNVTNCGYTMSTTREGVALLRDHLHHDHQLVLIQFGLVDAYVTCSFWPYVPYYPDWPGRKIYRNIVKKLNKISTRMKLRALLGTDNVVPIQEYQANIESMIRLCGKRDVVVIETVPHHEQWRNEHIQRYNAALEELAERYECLFIKTYSLFNAKLDDLYQDSTHANAAGYECITEQISTALLNKLGV